VRRRQLERGEAEVRTLKFGVLELLILKTLLQLANERLVSFDLLLALLLVLSEQAILK
jgi:hypothetical protein